jgi:hypothetical protein
MVAICFGGVKLSKFAVELSGWMFQMKDVGKKALNFLLCSAGISLIVLVRQNRELKSAVLFPSPSTVRLDQVDELGGMDLDGKFRSVPMAGPLHLLLFTFSPSCSQCQLSQPLETRISAEAKKLGWQTLWISRGARGPTKSYCEANNIDLSETLVNPPFETYVKLGMAAVPQVIAFGSGGRVEQVWKGRLDEGTASQISSFLARESVKTQE